MTDEQIHDILTTGPSAEGEIPGLLGGGVAYRVELLPPGKLNQLKIERNRYLASLGIDECTAATAEIYDAELQFRVCAEAVRHAETGAPLAALEDWRRHIGAAVRTCLDHYTQLEATSGRIDMELADCLPQLAAYVRSEQGPGLAAYWQTVDYETLLACFAQLSLEHDQVLRELEATREA